MQASGREGPGLVFVHGAGLGDWIRLTDAGHALIPALAQISSRGEEHLPDQ